MTVPRILVIDDEKDMLYACRRILQGLEIQVETESGGQAALRRLAEERFDAVLLDLVMPGLDGLETLDRLKQVAPDTEVIVITAYPTVETAIQATRRGAFGYVTKPFTPEQIQMTLEMALAYRSVKGENVRFRTHFRASGTKFEMIGESRAFRECISLLRKAADSDCNVLLLGETGTGKGLAAQVVHAHSGRREMPFVPLDCGAMSETLLESEMFGHERGAFTGASEKRIGLLEYAKGGTILLDEVGEMGQRLQVALLRVLQDGTFRRVGGNALLETDVRVLAATNRSVDAEVQRGGFRNDLFFRLDVLRIVMPPLRERPEDIPLLVSHFLTRLGRRRAGRTLEADPEAIDRLIAYPWPGNVRELFNVLERASVLAESNLITPRELPADIHAQPSRKAPLADFQRQKTQVIDAFERDYLSAVLAETDGNVRHAARMAGMPRSSLQRLLKKHGLSSGVFRDGQPE